MIPGPTTQATWISPTQIQINNLAPGVHTIRAHLANADHTIPGNPEAQTTIQITITNTCGNSALDPGEQCDDGNSLNNDGCSQTCQIESGWNCSGSPSVCTQNSTGPTYYFSQSLGNDLNDGLSVASPKESLLEMKNLLESSTAKVVRLLRGDTWTIANGGDLTINPPNTDPLNPVVIEAYGSGSLRPVIHVAAPRINNAIFELIHLGLSNQVLSGFVFRDLHLLGPDGDNNGTAIGIYPNAHYLTVDNVTFENFNIGINSQGTTNNSHFIIEDSSFVENTYWGFLGSFYEGLMRRNLFFNNGNVGTFFHHNAYVRALNSIIENNLFDGSSGGCITTHESINLTIRDNVMRNCDTALGMGSNPAGGQVYKMHNITIERNFIYNNEDTVYGYNHQNLVFKNNIVFNSGGFLFGDPTGNYTSNGIKIYNNIFHNTGINPDLYFTDSVYIDLDIRNNIFFSDAIYTGFQPWQIKNAVLISSLNTAQTIIQNNLYYNNDNMNDQPFSLNNVQTSLAQALASFGFEAAQLSGNPNLANTNPSLTSPVSSDFTLTSTSVLAIDQGAVIGAVIDDFEGNPRPQGVGYDIGAFEHS